MKDKLLPLLPFLRWFPLSGTTVKADLIAGITVALVLIPQSMAYAQLAGLPVYYGLYAAFLPVLIGALWGSSHQLATGPVAMVSILTGAALVPLAATDSEQFVMLAITVALLVGIIQLLLGLFKFGAIVNFLSHPVVMGFTNAAAVIIALSQLNKLLGVSMGRSEHFFVDVWGVLQQIGETHLPTLLMGLTAIVIMVILKKFLPMWPNVLIAVAITTVASWMIGFENNYVGSPAQIADLEVRQLVEDFNATDRHIKELKRQVDVNQQDLRRLEKSQSEGSPEIANLKYQMELLALEIKDAEKENRSRQRTLRKFILERVPSPNREESQFYLKGKLPSGSQADGHRWHIRQIKNGEITWVGGGEVVGSIPPGLPSLAIPKLNVDLVMSLFSSALVISFLGFMEAISMAKAMAARTKQRLDPNQELIGQGLANIVGSFTQSYPVSGSFSRSAVNLNAGAVTGMSSVFTWLVVLVVLLFLTPLLYHLPQAVLAAVILMAVVGLVNVKAIRHAWQVHPHDGIAAGVTFFATLILAPALDVGILIGAGFAIVLYLLRTMKPRVAVLGRHADGTLRDARIYNLPTSEHIAVMRFDGELYFANVPYFEDAILELAANYPKARFILIVGEGINQLDASGEEMLNHLVQRFRSNGVTLVFSGLKKQVIEIMQSTDLYQTIGADHFFRTEDGALSAIYERISDPSFDANDCPLNPVREADRSQKP